MYSIFVNIEFVRLFNAISSEHCLYEPCGTDTAGINSEGQGELFSSGNKYIFNAAKIDIDIITGLYSQAGVDFLALPACARRLYEMSVNAFDAIAGAWLSELPITAEIVRFGRKVLDTGAAITIDGQERRKAADRAATDRGDPDTRAVLNAAGKVWHEINRMQGLLRFCPDEDGAYIACCEPDHFVLPALGPHFRARFGQTPWAIIDNRRRVFLRCEQGREPQFCFFGNAVSPNRIPGGEWENLWRLYHKTINNESRNNPDLQRCLMPRRYWKYLTEL